MLNLNDALNNTSPQSKAILNQRTKQNFNRSSHYFDLQKK